LRLSFFGSGHDKGRKEKMAEMRKKKKKKA
jgi:hypothetical protein